MRHIKQINNLTIKEYRLTEMRENGFNRDSTDFRYAVFTPDNRILEDRLTLEQAEKFCRKTTDFKCHRKIITDMINRM